MEKIPSRDITGHCEGECRDLVREGEEKRQSELSAEPYSNSGPSLSVPWAKSRNESPGIFGGHV
jgi:hypothetical protein